MKQEANRSVLGCLEGVIWGEWSHVNGYYLVPVIADASKNDIIYDGAKIRVDENIVQEANFEASIMIVPSEQHI